ncbi:MAG: 50S ribosomal protein L20 [Deltaproteobacteria bacterium CG1_02_45_11]|nr:MAG: 50S ribosomal protein L20 [Deltaproteobacteria bacterium CG1_02_45_11]
MPRVKHAVATKKRHKRFLKLAKGQFLGRSKRYRQARESVQKGMYYSYRDRKVKKRLFRSLWITRISGACKLRGISYSKFMAGLKRNKVTLDRKVLADLVVRDQKAFDKLIELVKA